MLLRGGERVESLVGDAALRRRLDILDVLVQRATVCLERGRLPRRPASRHLLLIHVNVHDALFCIDRDVVAVLRHAKREGGAVTSRRGGSHVSVRQACALRNRTTAHRRQRTSASRAQDALQPVPRAEARWVRLVSDASFSATTSLPRLLLRSRQRVPCWRRHSPVLVRWGRRVAPRA